MAGTLPCGTYSVENRVLLAVNTYLEEFEKVARSQTLNPEFITGRRPESCLALPECSLESQRVHITKDEHLAGSSVLGYGGDNILSARSDLP